MKKTILLVSIFLSIIYNLQVLAQSEPPDGSGEPVLSVRQLPNSDYEAVVTYGTDQFCFFEVNPASSIQIMGNSISIESSAADVGICIEPSPPFFVFSQTAELGALAQGEYTLDWVQATDFSLTTTFQVSGLPPEPIANANPYPEPGIWYNPDQSGSGFGLEFQNGIMAGNYYGYDENGEPEWYLFANKLTRSEEAGVMWELEVQPERYTGGNCMGCEYQAPAVPELLPAIKIEFLQRAYAKVTFSNGSIQYMVPIIYGSEGAKYFEDETPYVFPTYGGGLNNEPQTYFMFVTKPNTVPPSPWLWESRIMPIGAGNVASGGSSEGKLIYKTWIPAGPPGPDVFPDLIVCELDQVSSEPGCKWVAGPKEYVISIGNMTDSRIFGEAEDGSTLEGYRLDYD